MLIGAKCSIYKSYKKKLFDLPKHHPKLGKVKEYKKSNGKNARNTKRQNLKPVKNDRSGLLVLISGLVPVRGGFVLPSPGSCVLRVPKSCPLY